MESRYFESKKCKFCRSEDHLFKDCPEKLLFCPLCKETHDPLFCPLSEICWNCYNRGHVKQKCRETLSRRWCGYCKSTSHRVQDCHVVWRTYLYSSSKTPQRVVKSCYMCAGNHFGDDCPNDTGGSYRYSCFYSPKGTKSPKKSNKY